VYCLQKGLQVYRIFGIVFEGGYILFNCKWYIVRRLITQIFEGACLYFYCEKQLGIKSRLVVIRNTIKSPFKQSVRFENEVVNLKVWENFLALLPRSLNTLPLKCSTDFFLLYPSPICNLINTHRLTCAIFNLSFSACLQYGHYGFMKYNFASSKQSIEY